MSEHTISDYPRTFNKLAEYLQGNPSIASISREKLIEFFAWLQETYTTDPGGVARRKKQKLSQKTILNYHTNLSALWEWAKQEGFVRENLLHKIPRSQGF